MGIHGLTHVMREQNSANWCASGCATSILAAVNTARAAEVSCVSATMCATPKVIFEPDMVEGGSALYLYHTTKQRRSSAMLQTETNINKLKKGAWVEPRLLFLNI